MKYFKSRFSQHNTLIFPLAVFIFSIVHFFQELLSRQYYSTFAYSFILLFPKVALGISNSLLSGNVVFFFTDVSPWIPKTAIMV